MALPNLNAPTKVEGKNASLAVTTTPTALVSNAAGSNKTLRVNLLFIANIDGDTAADLTADLFDGTTPRHIVSTLSIPPDATLQLIDERPLYIMEGQSLRLATTAANDLEAVCSYEEIS